MRLLVPLSLLALAAASIAAASHSSAKPENPRREQPGEVELAPFMSRLQIYSQKLGYSIDAKNQQLADFYLHEIHEVVEEIAEEVPVHDGHQIATMIKATIQPTMSALEKAMKSESTTWDARSTQYKKMMASCNLCHTATAHGYIHVLPAAGTPPFNQRFTPEPTPTVPK